MNFVRYLFEHSAESSADCLLGYRTGPLSHSQLWTRVGALADVLECRGRGANYVLLSPNGAYFVICYLATMLSGNVVVPLEPRISRRELRRVVDICQPTGAFVDRVLLPKWRDIESEVEPLVDLDAAPGDSLYSDDFPGQATGTVVNAAPAPGGGWDLLAVAQIESAAHHTLHLKANDGAPLALRPLPYALPE